MTRRATLSSLLLAAFFLAFSGAAAHAGKLVPAKDPADALMKKLVDAVKANDHAAFVADGTAKHQAISKATFNLVSAHFAPMLLKGYKTTFLAVLRKPDNTTHLWKLEPTGAGFKEDYELKLVIKDGKVDSFSIL
ncbi:MAG TPA: hypothetical protein VHJ20_00720 [Polyangia bacterium]|nr:hypothetical protein [Polyangia bacterium]